MLDKTAITCTNRIERSQYNRFIEVLEACNGYSDRAFSWPGAGLMMQYHFDNNADYREFHKRWGLLTMPIKEVRRDSGWRRLLRQFRLGFVERRIGVRS